MEVTEKSLLAGIGLIATLSGAKPMWDVIKTQLDNKKAQKYRSSYMQQLAYVSAIYTKMDEIRYNTTASRVVIFAGHNCGGMPRVGAKYFTTALHWSVDAEVESLMPHYREINVGSNYIKMLIQAEECDCYHFKTEEEKPCQLKRYYQAEGVTEALIYHLDIIENSLVYVSVATHSADGFSDRDLTLIEVEASMLRDLVKRSNKNHPRGPLARL